ncbi:FecCD family ABC transporter permease [Cellulomonas timonensis]|uniref:FecCD family ABC transporter permease n=1 Tax=Cellulomonas timonensis TaxID=1689271 RepID=UPI00082F1788|nr:iron chelate uptake ABC transporter family permease subunit [Cellulomonas timonensis]
MSAPTLTRPDGAEARVPVLSLGPLGALHWKGRAVLVCVAMLALAVVAALLTLTIGELGIPLRELPDVLTGNGTRAQEWVLRTNRLPRLLVGALAGAAFGVAGSIFQSVTRNPLGSPDVIGLGAGAAAGAAAASLVWPGFVPASVGALAGAGIAIGAVYVGSGRGFAAPYRMVVTGIAIGAMALAFVQLALARATREDAFAMAAWLNGSLASRRWSDVTLIALALLVLIPTALLLTRRLQLVEMGDDAAIGLGVDPTRTRNLAVGVAVLLTSAAVTVSGPVAFVALTAPQIARRLTRSSGPGMVAAACTGATVLVVADLLAQRLPFGVQYPVGVVTAALGGVYLAILLIREWRRGAV